ALSCARGRAVQYLESGAFEEMAEPMLRQLAATLTEKHGLSAVAIHHRIGRGEIGEPSVVIAVSAPPRAAALDACREAIDTLKETIPLWKKEVYAGGEEWIGRGSVATNGDRFIHVAACATRSSASAARSSASASPRSSGASSSRTSSRASSPSRRSRSGSTAGR